MSNFIEIEYMTESERESLDINSLKDTHTVIQTDGEQKGFWQVTEIEPGEFRWDYIGGRPPKR